MSALRTHHIHRLLYDCLVIILALSLKCQTSRSSATPLGVFMERSPESIVAPLGDEVLFECKLNLDPERLEWRFRPLNSKMHVNQHTYLDKDSGYNITNDGETSKLRIYVSRETLGEYQCVAWYGSSALASIPARLTLASIALQGDEAGSRLGPPPEQILRWRVSPKNSVLIKCGDVLSSPSPVWSFYKDNMSLPQSAPQLPSGALVLESVEQSDSGLYACTAVNAITGMELRLPQKVLLTIDHTPRSAPQFLMEPQAKFTARPGQTVVLECPGIGNPPPKAVWSRPDAIIPNSRTSVLDYGLQILDVSAEDQGMYVCRLDNGISPVIVQTILLQILEQPLILRGPQATRVLANESESLQLECVAVGSPQPNIYWMINGADTRGDPVVQHDGNKMIIRSVEKRHAGIVQCFARNEIGEVNQGNLLQVNPKQIPGELGIQPLGSFPTRSPYDHSGKQNKGRKKHKIPNMIPPSRPNVTRLSDDAVMIRWNVPNNDGLPIQFFKVQYRMLGNPEKTIPRENWQTTNDDIPFGKRDKNNNGVKNFTSAVTGLKPDRLYRFRILAVYSNNDNKEGNSSGKFLLQRATQLGPQRSHLAPPALTKVEATSETEIVLHWSFPQDSSSTIEGFYAYYRPASTAGEYFKATVDGGHTRHFKIDMLESGTAYEFKLQSFTASTASDFSSILTGKTLKPAIPPNVITPSVVPASSSSEDSNSIFPVIAGGAGGIVLLIVAAVVVCFCIRKRKKTQRDEVSKPQLDNIIQNESSNYMHSQHKSSHRSNGLSKINITPNPFEEGDKNRNVMELRFLPTTGSCGGSNQQMSVNSAPPPVPPHHHHHQQSQPPFHHQHQQYISATAPTVVPASPSVHHKQPATVTHQLQNNNHHQHHPSGIPLPQNNHFQAPMTPSMEHRRTLDRSARNLHYQQSGLPQHSGTSLDAADGIGIPTKIPSLRRTRRTSGSANNNNGGVGGCSTGIPGSPRVQRSPMPVRAIKRNRLGSHTENMSSGSLNSIEV